MKIDNSIYDFFQANVSFIGVPRTDSKTPNRLTKKSPDLVRFALNNKDDYDKNTGKNVFDELKINDYGNVEDVTRVISGYGNQKLFFIGGEHTITKDIILSLKKKVQDLHLVVFDAHLDVREKGESNACFLREIIDSGVKVNLIGQRVYSKKECEYVKKKGLKILKDLNIKDKNVYVSFDIDVIDSVFVPSCSTPEPFGENLEYYNDLLCKICNNNNIIGFDFVEFSSEKYDITYSNIAGLIMNVLKTFLKH